MCLSTKSVLGGRDQWLECGRMSGVLESVQNCLTLAAGEIELAWAAIRNVRANDAVNLIAVWLDCDYGFVSNGSRRWNNRLAY